MSSATLSDTPSAQPVGARRWLGLVSISIAQLLVTLDIMIVNIALPSVQADLDFSDASRAWIVTAYTLAFGSLMLISGRLADRLGRRTMFIIGLFGFAAASAIGGLASSFEVLVAARAIQGAFAAMLAPSALALVAITFPTGPARGRAFGIFGAISMAGGAIGLILGGLLTEFSSWRWTMFVGVIFAVPAILGALAFLDADRNTNAVRIDIASVLLVCLGLLGVVYGFTNAGEESWASLMTYLPLSIGLLLLVFFFVRQARIETPLLPLHILADRSRAGSFVSVLLAMAALLASVFFSMVYVQTALGWTSVATGLAFLPQPIAVIVASVFLRPRLNRRFGPKVLIPLSFLLGCLHALVATTISPTASYISTILPGLVLLGLGGGLFFPTANALATSSTKLEEVGITSAIMSTSQQVGGTLGVAILNTVAGLATAGYAVSANASPSGVEAIVHGFSAAFKGAAMIYAIGAVLTAILLPRRQKEAVF
jgi:EmrB/QacA subfamily drug resistance transporter